MGTNVRPEISKKNPYYIERERYYELKHFCRQYPIWKKAYVALDGLSKRREDLEVWRPGQKGDPTVRCAEARDVYGRKIEMVEKCANEAASDLYSYLMSYITKGDSYSTLKMRDNIPCCKDVFYDIVRKFYWLLSKVRD